MEIQENDDETLTTYVYCFKTAAKPCFFDNGTMDIHIFVKKLWNAHTTAAMIYERGPQTLSKVIRIVDKFNAAQQLTAMLTPSTVSMVSDEGRCFVNEQVILAATVPMHSVTAVMN